MPKYFASHILEYYQTLSLAHIKLPEGIRAMNPFREENARRIYKISKAFYRKYYQDRSPRHLILGINPGRLGAGATGLPFTDTKRLEGVCGISAEGMRSHEPSSVFVYDMIEAYGGPEIFYEHYYISSVCPLGFVKRNAKGKEVNFNYYDEKEVFDLLKDYMVEQLRLQMKFGIERDKCFCLGTGKNFKHLTLLNKEFDLFDEIIPLEHPRYIIQYKLKMKQDYINKYLSLLK